MRLRKLMCNPPRSRILATQRDRLRKVPLPQQMTAIKTQPPLNNLTNHKTPLRRRNQSGDENCVKMQATDSQPDTTTQDTGLKHEFTDSRMGTPIKYQRSAPLPSIIYQDGNRQNSDAKNIPRHLFEKSDTKPKLPPSRARVHRGSRTHQQNSHSSVYRIERFPNTHQRTEIQRILPR